MADYFTSWCLVCERLIPFDCIYCSDHCQFHDFCASMDPQSCDTGMDDITASRLNSQKIASCDTNYGPQAYLPYSSFCDTSDSSELNRKKITLQEQNTQPSQLKLQALSLSLSSTDSDRSCTLSPSTIASHNYPQLLNRRRKSKRRYIAVIAS